MHRSRKVVNVAKLDASKSAICCIDFPIEKECGARLVVTGTDALAKQVLLLIMNMMSLQVEGTCRRSVNGACYCH